MQQAAWRTVATVFLIANLVVVSFASAMHLAFPEEEQGQTSSGSPTTDVADPLEHAAPKTDPVEEEDNGPTPKVESAGDNSTKTPSGKAGPETEAASKVPSARTAADHRNESPNDSPANENRSVLDELAPPSTLPEVPSLADPDALENDPVFQEFQSIFGGDQAELDVLAPVENEATQAATDEYFESLDQRLLAVRHLTMAAQSIAAEAQTATTADNSGKAEKLIRMSAQLRELAAELLVTEL